jgi:hypothetical protein
MTTHRQSYTKVNPTLSTSGQRDELTDRNSLSYTVARLGIQRRTIAVVQCALRVTIGHIPI